MSSDQTLRHAATCLQSSNPFARLDFFDQHGTLVVDRCSAVHSLDPVASSTWHAYSTLPDRHPDRMIAASIVLYVGLGIVSAVTVWNHWKGGPLRLLAVVGMGNSSGRIGSTAPHASEIDCVSTSSPAPSASGVGARSSGAQSHRGSAR